MALSQPSAKCHYLKCTSCESFNAAGPGQEHQKEETLPMPCLSSLMVSCSGFSTCWLIQLIQYITLIFYNATCSINWHLQIHCLEPRSNDKSTTQCCKDARGAKNGHSSQAGCHNTHLLDGTWLNHSWIHLLHCEADCQGSNGTWWNKTKKKIYIYIFSRICLVKSETTNTQ